MSRTVVSAVLIVMPFAGCGEPPSPSGFAGCYEWPIGPFAPPRYPVSTDSLRPRWVRLTTTFAVTQPPPWTEGRYIASFSPEFESFWYWTGGWEPIGGDSLRIDWIRTGDWYEYRVELRGDTLRGTGTATTDTGVSTSFAVTAGAVDCDAPE